MLTRSPVPDWQKPYGASLFGVIDQVFDVLMFPPDPLTGLRSIRRALKPDSRFCAMVFSTPQANPCIATLMATAFAHAGLPPRDPFAPGGLLSLGAPGRMDALAREAGFREVATTRLAAPFRLPSAVAWLEFARSSASPIQQILSGLDDAGQEAAWADMQRKLQTFQTSDEWVGPNELLLTAGRR